MSKIIPKEIEFAVVSPGGVATTSLIHFFACNHKVNAPNDEDSLKHMPVPPVSFHPRFKYIHVFGDPVVATISLFRRKFQELQSLKLQRGTGMKSPIPIEMTVEEYACLGKDRLLFENFFENYYSRHLHYPTLFIRYESLWDHLDVISDFLDIPKKEFESFPQKIHRESEKQTMNSEITARLREMYSGFYRKVDGLPGAFIRGGIPRKSRASLVASKSFSQAMKNGIRSKIKSFEKVYGS